MKRTETSYELFGRFTDGTYHCSTHGSEQAAKNHLRYIKDRGIGVFRAVRIWEEIDEIDPEGERVTNLKSTLLYREGEL